MKYKIVAFLLVFLLSKNILSQVGVLNKDQFTNVKGKLLVVNCGDTTTNFAKEMMAAIRSVWTISPLKFGSISSNSDCAFVSLVHDNRSFSFLRENSVGLGDRSFSSSAPINNDYFYLHFWTANNKKTYTLARAELSLKSIGTGYINFSSSFITSTSFENDFCNGLPGYIKNIFQTINDAIKNDEEISLKKDMEALPELAQLKKDTLYVPNYWVGPGGTMLPDDDENTKLGRQNLRFINNMLAEYKYPIKLVRRDELSKMIMAAKKSIYYFNYVQSSADKMISVVNGFTGKMLYYEFNRKSYRPKGKDFDKLSNAVAETN